MEPEFSSLISKIDKQVSVFARKARTKKAVASGPDDITLSDFLSDTMLIIFMIREGVPYNFFNLIQNIAPFSENEWAEFLDMSTKSLQRYKQTLKTFRPIHSEKIIQMAEVTNMGLDVFGTMEKFKLWLNTSSFALGKMKPLDLLKDSYGKELVLGELTRINYGIFA
ncbi:MAG: DUF2384 domain-containing protein [Chitinophagaceae bacterium]|nr:MAG: DUF2384 domain-containing protein [Chitinophagaceae bacterium]